LPLIEMLWPLEPGQITLAAGLADDVAVTTVVERTVVVEAAWEEIAAAAAEVDAATEDDAAAADEGATAVEEDATADD
jgi:hypothetical protein